ncbi:hypothetical protein F444_15486 [Phytophthora nicotianae P1976]|uniref:Myb/SANT-like domain-containing protein n=1 Tax=Phytophthora nicotianae P1976 TaxID=1317066 RepID=A0A080ZLV0_PHYNI|nr:hypothetical protein F444_15486 [Phytophthora nicotianae P1976]
MPNAAPWSHEEDIRLCRAYTNISEDDCISTDQDVTHFWDRIHQTYTQLGEDYKKNKGLQSRWFNLKHTVAGQTKNIR